MPQNDGLPEEAKAALSFVIEGSSLERLELAEGLDLPLTLLVEPVGILAAPQRWRDVAAKGHLFGNASLGGVTDNGRLDNWSLKTVEQELHMTQQFLADFFQVQPRTFGYPGPIATCADGPYREVVDKMFDFAVSVELGSNQAPFDFKYLSREIYLGELEAAPGSWSVLFLDPDAGDPPELAGFEERGFSIERLESFGSRAAVRITE